jgi:hypothetical protein
MWAGQWLDAVPAEAMYAYLLDADTALELLTRMLRKDPKKAVAELQRLASGKRPAGRGGRKPARAAKKRKAAPARGRKAKKAPGKAAKKAPGKAAKKAPGKAPRRAAKKAKAGRRNRMTPEQSEQVKKRIRAFLTKSPWSTRKEISQHAGISSQAVYRRIMGELRSAGEVISKGQKAKAIYALKGAA